jgi:hypothetical protein
MRNDRLQTNESASKKSIETDSVIYRMEQVISFDKIYWKNVFDGRLAVNPVMLKIIVNRLLGKAETGNDLLTEQVLSALNIEGRQLLYWQEVFDGTEKAEPDALKQLFWGLL